MKIIKGMYYIVITKLDSTLNTYMHVLSETLYLRSEEIELHIK